MHVHWCGNPLHDVAANLVALLVHAADWLPFLRAWARGRQCLKCHEENGELNARSESTSR